MSIELPISKGDAIYAFADRRQRSSFWYEAGKIIVKDKLNGRTYRFQATVTAVQIKPRLAYEVVVHHSEPVQDDRCIVACFYDVKLANNAMSSLSATWLTTFGKPPADPAPRSFDPCPN